MTERIYKKTDKKGREEEWIWEETPELREWIKQQSVNKLSAPPKRPT
tara:strand:+ start:2348 stop:2488 length:141 start_codon:yes stop_codon:yes gene_type:complete